STVHCALGDSLPGTQPYEPGQRLQRLSKAHVVRQNSAKSVLRQVSQKMESFHLVGSEFRRHYRGDIGSDSSLKLRGAALEALDLVLRQETFSCIVGKLESVEPLWLGG